MLTYPAVNESPEKQACKHTEHAKDTPIPAEDSLII